MRMLTICDRCGIGGQQRIAVNFAKAFKARGHESTFFAYREGGVREQELADAAVPVILGEGRLDDAIREVVDLRPEVAFIHRTGYARPMQTHIMKALREAGCRIIEKNVFSRVDRSVGGRLIDVHIHMSRWCLWRWRTRGGKITRRQVGVVIPNAVDAERFQPATAEQRAAYRRDVLQVGADAFVLGRIGQPLAPKWDPSTVYAFRKLASEHRDVHLALIGAPDEILAEVGSLDAPLRERVRVLPMTSDDNQLRAFYSCLNVFLHSARIGESFGSVLVESMYCGTPVVTANRPHKDNSQIEVVRHGVDGLVAGSTASLAEAVAKLHADRQLLHELGEGLRERAMERFERDRVADQVLRVSEILLQTPRESLQDALRREASEFLPDASSRAMRDLMKNSIGRPRLEELLWKRVLHNPLISRAIDEYLVRRYLR